MTQRLNFRNIIFIGTTSLALLFATDYFFGDQLIPQSVDRNSNDSPKMRIAHDVYHHTIVSNLVTQDVWGEVVYQICTDGNGFKSACGEETRTDFDIAIIGDSFTEGIGFPYEKTFVGLIAKANPTLTIANLAATSYSPSIYLAKIRYLLNQGYTFGRLHVYVDISDIQDEVSFFITEDGRVIDPPSLQPQQTSEPSQSREPKETLKSTFPLTYEGLWGLRATIKNLVMPSPVVLPLVKEKGVLDKGHSRSGWTYDRNVEGYKSLGVDGAIEKSIAAMVELYTLAKENNIEMSVGVYPWPGQILYGTRESRQVKIWKEFCLNRCEYFFDSFERFFNLKEQYGADRVIKEFYIDGDCHFNENGHRIIAKTYLLTTQPPS